MCSPNSKIVGRSEELLRDQLSVSLETNESNIDADYEVPKAKHCGPDDTSDAHRDTDADETYHIVEHST